MKEYKQYTHTHIHTYIHTYIHTAYEKEFQFIALLRKQARVLRICARARGEILDSGDALCTWVGMIWWL